MTAASRFDPARFRRVVAGLSLIAAPLLGLVWSCMVPLYTDGMRGEVAFVAAHATRWWTGTYAGVLCSFLLVPATLGLLHVARGRGALVAHLGGILLMTGAAFHGALITFQLAEVPLVAHVQDVRAALPIATALFEGPVFTAVLVPVMGMFLGLLVLGVVLWRMRAISWVSALAIVAAVIVEVGTPIPFKARLCFALLTVGLGLAGVRLLRMEDEEWKGEGSSPAARDSARGVAARVPSAPTARVPGRLRRRLLQETAPKAR